MDRDSVSLQPPCEGCWPTVWCLKTGQGPPDVTACVSF